MDSNSKKPTPQKNVLLQRERDSRNWTLQDVADKLFDMCIKEGRKSGISADTVGRWERGISKPESHYRAKLCDLFDKNAMELGFLDQQSSNDDPRKSPEEDAFVHFTQSIFDLEVADKLDSAESIINLAWEAWFASRPREAARVVNKLLPGLEKIAYSMYLPVQTLRAKKLAIRAH